MVLSKFFQKRNVFYCFEDVPVAAWAERRPRSESLWVPGASLGGPSKFWVPGVICARIPLLFHTCMSSLGLLGVQNRRKRIVFEGILLTIRCDL